MQFQSYLFTHWSKQRPFEEEFILTQFWNLVAPSGFGVKSLFFCLLPPAASPVTTHQILPLNSRNDFGVEFSGAKTPQELKAWGDLDGDEGGSVWGFALWSASARGDFCAASHLPQEMRRNWSFSMGWNISCHSLFSPCLIFLQQLQECGVGSGKSFVVFSVVKQQEMRSSWANLRIWWGLVLSALQRGQIFPQWARTHFKHPGNYSGVFSCLTSSLEVKKKNMVNYCCWLLTVLEVMGHDSSKCSVQIGFKMS